MKILFVLLFPLLFTNAWSQTGLASQIKQKYNALNTQEKVSLTLALNSARGTAVRYGLKYWAQKKTSKLTTLVVGSSEYTKAAKKIKWLEKSSKLSGIYALVSGVAGIIGLADEEIGSGKIGSTINRLNSERNSGTDKTTIESNPSQTRNVANQ